ncbi:MAG: SusC/RagA family TonB-linked outer membrane protein [Bacteroidales bacterium]|nr:SusC/RagA family TonB-linked outer membrane protein [Bacteroidales bacterium]
MKKNREPIFLEGRKMLKLYRIMKLSVVLLLIGMLQVSASVYSQGNRVKLKESNITLAELFWKIQSQTDFVFAFSNEDVEAFSSIDVNTEGDIEDILNEILADKDLSFELKNGVYVIHRKAPEPTPVVVEEVQEEKKMKISGTVRDENGEPLPFAAVCFKGTTYGCVSAVDGHYVLEAPVEEGLMLEVSSLGFKTQEIEINGRTVIDIVLVSDIQGIDEVVVTGFTQISRERSSGSFGKLSEDLIDKPAIDISERLVGTLAGVQQVVDEQGNKRFEIRGQSSLKPEYGVVASPLIVVDGFPIEGEFESVNPNDIESVTILKDAAAASIWGARSGNGVIVITTKKAKKAQPTTVEFSSFWRFQNKRNLTEELNRVSAADQIELEKFTWLTTNDWGSPAYLSSWGLPGNSSNDIAKARLSATQTAFNEFRLGNITEEELNAQLAKYGSFDNTQQIKDHLLQNPFTQQYNLAISGATKKMRNRISLMFEDSKTDYKGDDKQKYMVNYNMSYNFTDFIRFDLNTNFNYQDDTYNGSNARIYYTDSPFQDAISVAPYQQLINSDGSLARWTNGPVTSWGPYGNESQIYQPNFDRFVDPTLYPYDNWTYNPIEEINAREFRAKTIHARINAGLNIKLFKGLDIDSKFMYEMYDYDDTERYFEDSFEVRMTVNQTSGGTFDDAVAGNVVPNLPKGEFVDKFNRTIKAWNWRNQANYNRTFGKHQISLLIGQEISKRTTDIWVLPRSYGYDHERGTTQVLPNGPGNVASGFLYNSFIRDWYGAPRRITTPYPSGTGASFVSSFDGFRSTSVPGYFNDVYFSLYSNFSYTYNEKYSVTGSVRTDASNFISADPEYRYSPFWSIGGNWQAHKEDFMSGLEWLDRLALRASYGFNGNPNKSTYAKTVVSIEQTKDPDSGEYATTIFRGHGNPTLRWELIGQTNVGIDYSMWNGKLFGRVEYYSKKSEDLVTPINLPSFQGTFSANLNAVEMRNSGIEFEVGTTLPIKGRDIMFSGNLNFAYNNNEILKLYSKPAWVSALTQGAPQSYLEGYNANTLWAYKYAGMEDGVPMIEDKDGNKHDATNIWGLDGEALDYSYNQGVTVAPYIAGLSSNIKLYDFDLSFIIMGKFGHVFQRSVYDFWLPDNNASVSNLYHEALDADPNSTIPLPSEGYHPYINSLYGASQNMDYRTTDASHIRFQEINLSYNVPQTILGKTGLKNFRLYGQINNVGTILFNDYDEDPEYRFYKPRAVFTFGLKTNF